MDPDLVELHTALRIVTTVGYIAAVVLIIAVLYRLHNNYFGEESKKFRWVFIIIATITGSLFIYMYNFFFHTDLSSIGYINLIRN